MAHYPFALPVAVIINDRKYTVYGVKSTGSNAWHFMLRGKGRHRLQTRVCFAPPIEARSVFLSGEHIEYIWGEPLEASCLTM